MGSVLTLLLMLTQTATPVLALTPTDIRQATPEPTVKRKWCVPHQIPVQDLATTAQLVLMLILM